MPGNMNADYSSGETPNGPEAACFDLEVAPETGKGEISGAFKVSGFE